MSHKAINNLLEEIEQAADEDGVDFRGARKAAAQRAACRTAARSRTSATTRRCLDPQYRLVAGTTWLFAPESADEQLDYLVIDEAGQLSLADALAAGTAARNLILLGDPLQLPQVSQACIPRARARACSSTCSASTRRSRPIAGSSSTETRRMHPDVCRVHLRRGLRGPPGSHPDCALQSDGGEAGHPLPAGRARGNASQSPEEADAIAPRSRACSGSRYRTWTGRGARSTADDFMVVAPYNAQVRAAARSVLPAGVRVGTVDKFQGQEAPVVFFSMATSSGEDAPRGLALPVQPQPPERRDQPRALPRLPRVRAGAARGAREDGRGDAADLDVVLAGGDGRTSRTRARGAPMTLPALS